MTMKFLKELEYFGMKDFVMRQEILPLIANHASHISSLLPMRLKLDTVLIGIFPKIWINVINLWNNNEIL